jgi:pyruvate/2-oxoglutarate dehydrogenase complex dihydrolipoamide acyltransferase (E2) component
VKVSPTSEATTDEVPAAAETEAAQAQPSPEQAKAEAAPEQPAEQPAKRGRKPSTARKTRTVELTLTVTGTMEGEWQADLSHSGSRVLQGLQIPAAAVSRAAAELHEDISKAIESVLDVARQQHQARLAELEAELSKVKQALAELQDG